METVGGWAQTYQPRHPAPALRLFGFPYAGAGASTYAGWRLPDELAAEVWAVQPPGRETRAREGLIRRIEPYVEACADGLAALMDRPFAFFGHSMGALVAVELTRLLRRRGAALPVHLFVSAHRAPGRPPKRGPMSRLPDDEFVARLLEGAGDSPVAIRDPELLLAFAGITRVDLELCERHPHRPQAPLDTPLTCFAAVDDSEVDVADVAAWEHHTTGAYRLRTFTGGHLFLAEHGARILADVATDLARISTRRVRAGG
ncbi:thioesterase II family protein [Phytohabitans houttuyneae]|uniref:thioesterase II family protein n=1 Tax=Phytohabitans houttuyneae TaxID=1076126 RepID=UPI00156451EE|nr:alpha/beta fold hydrolase [Phytohabitans houttuyneae]